MALSISRGVGVAIAVIAVAATWAVSETPAIVSVDGKKVIATNDRFWTNAVFHPTEYLDSDWGKEHVELLYSGGVTLKYARFYNQFEDAAYQKDDGSIGYRWDHFDRRADLFVSRGVNLLISFYSMPPQIAADAKVYRKRSFLDGKKIYIGPPADYRQWQAACADFTRHVIERYGEDRVAKWLFTCWNEPDLSGFWQKGNVVEYRKVYDYFAEGVKSVSKRARIGGPAFSSSHIYSNPELFRGFLEHVANGTNHATGKQGSPIDYIPMHTYGGHGGGGGKVSPTPSVDYLLEQQRRIVAMRDEFPKLRDVPIVFQEWGVTSGGTTTMAKQPIAVVRNNNFAPAFLAELVARHLEWRLNEKPRVGDLFVCLSGYEATRKSDFEGKRTVQTVNGFDKPILNGYRLLSKLGSEWVASRMEAGEKNLSVMAARDGEKQLAVVVTRFMNDRVACDGPARMVKLQIDTPWADGTGVELRHWRIDGAHSNAYSVFCELGKPNPPSAEQAKRIRSRMGLEPLCPPRAMKVQGRVELEFELPCNGVSMVELVKK